MRTYIVCICSRTSQRPKALQDIINILCMVCMPTEQLKRLQLCTDAMGQNRGVLYEVLQYIVLVCSWTSQRPNTLQDINNMLHIVYMPAEQLKWLNLCRDSIGQWGMYYVRTYCIQCAYAHGPADGPKLSKDIINMLHTIYCICLQSARWPHLCRDARSQ